MFCGFCSLCAKECKSFGMFRIVVKKYRFDMTEKELSKKDESLKINREISNQELYLKFESKIDEKTGKETVSGLALSDGTRAGNLISEALKRATGTQNFEHALSILSSVSSGMRQSSERGRLNHAAVMLATLKPQDEMEALLLGQLLALQDSGMKCLHQANHQEQFYHEERFFMLASKLFAQTNATMQSLMKYRSRGQQTVQVVHLYNEGQAIVAQNLVQGGGLQKKQEIEPLGSL